MDAGCGTGRHSQYLAKQGFSVHGIDISNKAIEIADSKRNGLSIDYRVGTIVDLPYPDESMDYVLANHALEYASDEDVAASVKRLNRALRKGRPFFARVVSTQHPFYRVTADCIYGFSHVGFCIKNGLPVHFFSEDELKELFSGYKIERLEHISHEVDHEKISVPLREWVLLAFKQ